jgi:hypothetical protein
VAGKGGYLGPRRCGDGNTVEDTAVSADGFLLVAVRDDAGATEVPERGDFRVVAGCGKVGGTRLGTAFATSVCAGVGGAWR